MHCCGCFGIHKHTSAWLIKIDRFEVDNIITLRNVKPSLRSAVCKSVDKREAAKKN